jgi:exonuclease VII large subunit
LPASEQAEPPVLQAVDTEKIRALAGKPARIRGRVFRVGHSAKSNTYFLNFGPSRSALTAVIFASAVDLFEQDKLPPKGFDGREVEVHGEVKDHPQYGLEIVLNNTSQITILK